MTIDPFSLLKNREDLTRQISSAMGELKQMRAEGASGGGIVKAVVNGETTLVEIHIDPVAVDPRDVKMLEDLVVAACHDAAQRMEEMRKNRIGSMFSQMSVNVEKKE